MHRGTEHERATSPPILWLSVIGLCDLSTSYLGGRDQPLMLVFYVMLSHEKLTIYVSLKVRKLGCSLRSVDAVMDTMCF